MKSNKIIKWLYGLFMFVPFLAIGVKSMYVTFNKNAKDSYSDSSLIETKVIPTNINQITENTQIVFTYNGNSFTTQNRTIKYGFKTISFNPLDYGWDNRQWNAVQVTNTGTSKYIYLFDTNNTYQAKNIWGVDISSFSIISSGVNGDTTASLGNDNTDIYTISYQQRKLDNAFYYAIDEFNSIGFDKINFVSWFDFLYENTNVYTTFINSYVNYMLFVSLAFFIPRVLYWFINFAYNLTDSFSSKSNGGGW